MANNFKALNSLDFSGSNALRAQSANQIKQGLAQGQNAFTQFNTGLTNRATQEGLNQIRQLDSRAAVEANPLAGINPQYADQSQLQTAYDANKAKQQGLYEDDMMQQGMAKIQGIKTLEDYGKTSADSILNSFGANLSAAKKTKLLGAYESQDDTIKQQMNTDQQWDQNQQTLAEKPTVDALGVDIQNSTLNNLSQVQAKINSTNLSDATKASLLAKAEQRGIASNNIMTANRTNEGYNAQQTLNKFVAKNNQQTLKAENTFKTMAAKQNVPLTADGNFDESALQNMSISDGVNASRAYDKLSTAFEKSTKNTQEFNDYLTQYEGVAGFSSEMLDSAKAKFKTVQQDRSSLSPELQATYDEQMGLYKQRTQSQVDNLNRQKATVSQQYEDVAAITNKELSMTIGDATQSARTNLKAQGMDLDSGDMEDLMGFLKKNLDTEDPYVLAEVAKVTPIVEGFMFGDADYGWKSNAEVKKALDKVVKDVSARRNRAMASLDAISNIDEDIIKLNEDTLNKGKTLSGKLSILNPKTNRSLFNK